MVNRQSVPCGVKCNPSAELSFMQQTSLGLNNTTIRQQLFGTPRHLRNGSSCFPFLTEARYSACGRFGCVSKMASSRPTIVDEGDKTTRRVSWNVVLLSVVCVLFVLLYACTYFSLRCQLQQLRDDVDQLKVIHSMSLKPAAAAAGHGDDSSRVELRRSKRHDAVNAVNETNDHHNDTSNNDDKQGDGSGEITDHQYPGIWMGTYSRVPVS